MVLQLRSFGPLGTRMKRRPSDLLTELYFICTWHVLLLRGEDAQWWHRGAAALRFAASWHRDKEADMRLWGVFHVFAWHVLLLRGEDVQWHGGAASVSFVASWHKDAEEATRYFWDYFFRTWHAIYLWGRTCSGTRVAAVARF